MFDGDFVIGRAFAEFERALDRSDASFTEIMVTDDFEPVEDPDADEAIKIELEARQI